MLSAILLLLQLWDSGTQETDNERSAQGTSAPLLPLLQRFQNMLCGKDAPHAEGDTLVSIHTRLPRFSVVLRARLLQTRPEHVSVGVVAGSGDTEAGGRACLGLPLPPVHSPRSSLRAVAIPRESCLIPVSRAAVSEAAPLTD